MAHLHAQKIPRSLGRSFSGFGDGKMKSVYCPWGSVGGFAKLGTCVLGILADPGGLGRN